MVAARAGTDGEDSYFEALSASLNRGWAPLRGVVEGELKYVDLPLPELYDLRADPREEKNLVAARPRDVERLRGRLSSLRAGEASPAARVEEERGTLDALRALGYVSGGGAAAKEHYGEDDDPKRLVDLDARGERRLSRSTSGATTTAPPPPAPSMLRPAAGHARRLAPARGLERARGRLDAAIDAARGAVRLRPLDAAAASFLGVYLTEAGRAAEAVRLLEPYARAEAADPDVLTALGMAQARAGRVTEALWRRSRASSTATRRTRSPS